MLSNKYSLGENMFSATTNSSINAIKASIIRAKNVLINDFSWRADSGSSSFWSNRWSAFGCLRAQTCWNKMCLTLLFKSFDDNMVLKIVNWIC